MRIKEIVAREIKDSRGNPTVEVVLETERGSFVASCPSGASTGKNEAAVVPAKQAIENINTIIGPKLRGKDPQNQKELDDVMIALDGTPNKSKLGANAILPVSMAIARAGAAAKKIPLYQHIGEISNFKFQISNLRMPLPSFNFIEGGAHTVARNTLALQEFMVVPQKKFMAENMAAANTVFTNLQQSIANSFGNNVLMGDEGGFAPPIAKTEQALFLLASAIGKEDIKIIIDAAASQFFKGRMYSIEGKELSRAELMDFYQDLISRFPIIAIEDPFAEEDWEGFKALKAQLPISNFQFLIGDDLTTTNIKRIKEAENKKACNGVIIKPNQIGTVSETIGAANLAKSYGWKVMVSHRSGETADTFIADLAVGVGADFIKSGSPSQLERMAKYQRLLEIEQELK